MEVHRGYVCSLSNSLLWVGATRDTLPIVTWVVTYITLRTWCSESPSPPRGPGRPGRSRRLRGTRVPERGCRTSARGSRCSRRIPRSPGARGAVRRGREGGQRRANTNADVKKQSIGSHVVRRRDRTPCCLAGQVHMGFVGGDPTPLKAAQRKRRPPRSTVLLYNNHGRELPCASRPPPAILPRTRGENRRFP